MRKALLSMLGTGIALVLAKWIYDEAVGRYQMWVDAMLCEGFCAALEGIRGESGQFRAISVERIKELEEIEAAYKSCEVA